MAADHQNLLLFGDNLAMLREHVADASVDLVYLDPPFNSNATYNMLFKEQDGSRAAAQIRAFGDTWRWDAGASRAFDEAVTAGGRIADSLLALRSLVGASDMLAYLSMMAPRLVELHRVLRNTGSLYLHCDPTASHYLKLLLDAVFGAAQFRSEIIWKRTTSHNNVRSRFGDETDTILCYSKGPRPTFNVQYRPYTEEYIRSHYSQTDPDGRRFTTRDLRNPGIRPNLHYEYKGYKPHPNGWAFTLKKMKAYDAKGLLYFPPNPGGRIRLKRYLDEMPGTPMGTLWDDILPLNSQAQERLGYPTQKPEALLERIIRASTNPGDVVLDPFCGCGTAITAAQRLDRRWIGIDITRLAIDLIEKRLREAYHGDASYTTRGDPNDAADAAKLARDDRIEFQRWALGKLGVPAGDTRPGADRGIDGRLPFKDADGTYHSIIVSVKSGSVQVSHLRDLRGVLAREGASIGVLVTLEPPTRAMRREAASAGFVKTAWGAHPVLQLLTVDDLFAGGRIDYPHTAGTEVTMKRARRAKSNPQVIGTDLFGEEVTRMPRSRRSPRKSSSAKVPHGVRKPKKSLVPPPSIKGTRARSRSAKGRGT